MDHPDLCDEHTVGGRPLCQDRCRAGFDKSGGERCACPVEMRQKYSYECNEARVPPLLTRGARPITSVCEDAGVAWSTATNWLPRCGLVTAPPTTRSPEMDGCGHAEGSRGDGRVSRARGRPVSEARGRVVHSEHGLAGRGHCAF